MLTGEVATWADYFLVDLRDHGHRQTAALAQRLDEELLRMLCMEGSLSFDAPLRATAGGSSKLPDQGQCAHACHGGAGRKKAARRRLV